MQGEVGTVKSAFHLDGFQVRLLRVRIICGAIGDSDSRRQLVVHCCLEGVDVLQINDEHLLHVAESDRSRICANNTQEIRDLCLYKHCCTCKTLNLIWK